MSKTLNAFSQNSKTRNYSVLPRSPSIIRVKHVQHESGPSGVEISTAKSSYHA